MHCMESLLHDDVSVHDESVLALGSDILRFLIREAEPLLVSNTLIVSGFKQAVRRCQY